MFGENLFDHTYSIMPADVWGKCAKSVIRCIGLLLLTDNGLIQIIDKLIPSFKDCNADIHNLNTLIITKSSSGICRSVLNVLIGQWYNSIEQFIFHTVLLKKRRSQLSPWVTDATSNKIKNFHTVQSNQADNYKKTQLRLRS